MLSSCNNVLDVGSDGRLSYDVVFSDNILTSGYLNNCYALMPLNGMSYNSNNFFGVFTDEAQDAEDVIAGSVSLNYYRGAMTSSINLMEGGSNNTTYNNMYRAIRSCNIFIDHIDKATITVETNRNRWKGEAYTLRAFYYWHMIKRFGPLPLLKHDLASNLDSATLVRPTFYNCVKKILQDCDSALAQPNLPWRSSLDGDRGSMTKSVAVAIKSEAILFAASPQWNATNDNVVWKEAAAITKATLDSLAKRNYSLYNPKDANPSIKAYSDYQRLFLLKPEMVDNPTYDKETIYAQRTQLANVWQQNGPPMSTDVQKAGTCPSQELVDAYETLNGMPVLDPVNPYSDADHLVPNYNALNTQYDKTKPYLNRDPRLLSTIFCNGSNFNLSNNTQPVNIYVGGSQGISTTDRRYTRTGYYLRKFANYTSTKTANSDGYWRYFRLAEMYLNYAEADYFANGVTVAAVDALNKTRVRAGLPALSYSISTTEFKQRLQNERRVELAFEEHRYFDVRRWKIQSKVEGLVTGMSITGTGTYTYNRVVISRRSVTASKYMLWPIPAADQIKLSQLLKLNFQNSGW